LFLALWLIIKFNRMYSCMRSFHLFGVVVAVVGDVVDLNFNLRERWLPIWCCCCCRWSCGW
jgi:hypothetical protein